VGAQQAVRQPVEGADPHAANAEAEHGLDAPAHLGRSLVGEGHGQNGVRRDIQHLHQPRDPVGEHTRLAGTGAGQDQQRPGGAATASRWAGFRSSSRRDTSMPES